MKRIVAAIALASLLSIPSLASAGCAPVVVALQFHIVEHGQRIIESRKGGLPDEPEFIVQWDLWLNEETEIWAITATANGTTCMYFSGRGYNGETLDDVLLGEAA